MRRRRYLDCGYRFQTPKGEQRRDVLLKISDPKMVYVNLVEVEILEAVSGIVWGIHSIAMEGEEGYIMTTSPA